jgi:hypothetical protein
MSQIKLLLQFPDKATTHVLNIYITHISTLWHNELKIFEKFSITLLTPHIKKVTDEGKSQQQFTQPDSGPYCVFLH